MLLLFFVLPGIKNKLEWLCVGVVLNWKSLMKGDWIEPLNQDTDPLE